jgi:TM2 domain-containing membrane protein YozV
MLTKPKDRKVAAALAFAGAVPIPVLNGTISGLHKFYLGQPRWGLVYLLLGLTPIPTVASLIEGAWYLFQERHPHSDGNGSRSIASVGSTPAGWLGVRIRV